MIDINQIKQYYSINEQKKLGCIIKENIQLDVLNFLSSTKYAAQMSFIGGTNLRLVHGIDRFSEDLDFDIKKMDRDRFKEMSTTVETHLKNEGYNVTAKFEKEDKLQVFRCKLDFPGFAYENKLSEHKDKGFFIKIECQDQKIPYQIKPFLINQNNYIFNFPAPAIDILCSMKLSALLQRKKGRDFYDAMYLLNKTAPNVYFLKERIGINGKEELRQALIQQAETTNLNIKSTDFLHLEIIDNSHNKILLFKEFIEQHKLIDINDILKQSVRAGDITRVKEAILKGADIQTIDKSDFSNLSAIVKKNMLNSIQTGVIGKAAKDDISNLGNKHKKGRISL